MRESIKDIKSEVGKGFSEIKALLGGRSASNPTTDVPRFDTPRIHVPPTLPRPGSPDVDVDLDGFSDLDGKDGAHPRGGPDHVSEMHGKPNLPNLPEII
eukprot:405156-Karenia_brevis.AAC.1